MELLAANLSATTRRAKLNGIDYLIAPVNMIVPGVLNGSRGPLYYPLEEVSRDPQAWNGMPLVFGHPTNNDGDHVSARSPEILEKFQLGTVFNSDCEDELVAEAWFDINKTRQIERREGVTIIENIEAGKPIEVSTGLFTDNIPARHGATHNGKAYSAVARNYRPDHLAVLIGQRGACSVADGCGINVNEEDEEVENAFCATGEGGGRDNSCGRGDGNGADRVEQRAATTKLKEQAKSLPQVSKFSDEINDIKSSSTVRDLINAAGRLKSAMIGKGTWDLKESEQKALRDITSAAESLREKRIGEGAVENNEDGKCPDCGGPMTDGTCSECGYTTITNECECGGKPNCTCKKGTTMNREQMVKYLTTNCACWKGKEKILNSKTFADADLTALVKEAEDNKRVRLTANSLVQMANDGAGDETITFNEMPAFMKKKMESAKQGAEGEEPPVDPDETVPEEEVEPEMNNKGCGKMMRNQKKRQLTDNEWIAQAPPGVREQLRQGQKALVRQKRMLVNKLIANVEDEDEQKRMAANLMKLEVTTGNFAQPGLEELLYLQELNANSEPDLNEEFETDEDDIEVLNTRGSGRYGAQGGPLRGRLTENEQNDVLDWDEARKHYDPLVANKGKEKATA